MPSPYSKLQRQPARPKKAAGRMRSSGMPGAKIMKAAGSRSRPANPGQLRAAGTRSTATPRPNLRAMQRANANARFKRDSSGGLNPGKFVGEVGQNLQKGVAAAGKALDSVIPQRRSTTITRALNVTDEQRRKLRQAQGK